MFFYFVVLFMGCGFWIKKIIVIIKLGNSNLKLNTYCIWTERNQMALKGLQKSQLIRHQQNNDSLGVFKSVKPNQ